MSAPLVASELRYFTRIRFEFASTWTLKPLLMLSTMPSKRVLGPETMLADAGAADAGAADAGAADAGAADASMTLTLASASDDRSASAFGRFRFSFCRNASSIEGDAAGVVAAGVVAAVGWLWAPAFACSALFACSFGRSRLSCRTTASTSERFFSISACTAMSWILGAVTL